MVDKIKHIYTKASDNKSSSAAPVQNIDTPFPGDRLNAKIENEKFIELNDLHNQQYKLKTPFRIKISFQDGEFIGEIEELELYAFGESQEEVLDELRLDLIDLYENFHQINEKSLGEAPTRWKKILSSKIIES